MEIVKQYQKYETKYKITEKLIIAALLIVFVWFAGRKIKDWWYQNTTTEDDKDYVSLFYTALEADWWNEDETALFELAKELGTKSAFEKIDKKYNLKYGHYLRDKMAELLSTTDQNKFYSYLK